MKTIFTPTLPKRLFVGAIVLIILSQLSMLLAQTGIFFVDNITFGNEYGESCSFGLCPAGLCVTVIGLIFFAFASIYSIRNHKGGLAIGATTLLALLYAYNVGNYFSMMFTSSYENAMKLIGYQSIMKWIVLAASILAYAAFSLKSTVPAYVKWIFIIWITLLELDFLYFALGLGVVAYLIIAIGIELVMIGCTLAAPKASQPGTLQ